MNDVLKEEKTLPKAAIKRKPPVYNLMRNYIEREYNQSNLHTSRKDLEKEIDTRLAKLFS